jgi:hypothetical protein
MPILSPPIPQVYDTLNNVLNSARVRLNDTITTQQPITGRLLQSNQAFTLQLVNTAWRKFQEFLANLGFAMLRQEAIIFQLPPVASLDPSVQMYINWFNCFDGANLFTSPVLPPDLMTPLKLWERQTGTASVFQPMEAMVDGLVNFGKQSRNVIWEWRADGIYLPGPTISVDLRIRYNRYLADFSDGSNVQWFQQPVPLMRCLDPFSYYICAEVADAREGMDGDAFRAKAENSARLMMNRDIGLKQRTNVRRQSRSGRLEGYGTTAFDICY